MDSFEKAFSISQLNDWPNEAFVIGLSTQIIDPNLGPLPLVNSFIFRQNPINEIDDSFLIYNTKPKGTNSLVTFDTYNAKLGTDAFGLTEIDTFSNSTLVWYSSALKRNTHPGHLFNLFQLNATPGADPENTIYYIYLLYPPTLCLKPTNLINSGGNWQLTTSTVYTQASTFFLKSSTPDYFPYNVHQNYIKNSPVTSSIPPGFTLVYDLCAAQIINYKPIIEFKENYNPNYFSTILEPPGSKIRPYSTSIYYDVEYYTKNDDGTTIKVNLAQEPPIFSPPINPFRTAFLFNYNPFVSNKQHFQLVQRIPDGSNPLFLSLSTNCVLSATIDLDKADFKYYSNSLLVRIGGISNIINTLTGVPGTSIQLSYISDSPKIYLSNENVQNTLISWSGPGGATNLGTPINTSNAQTVVWTTKYPPHYYAYKVSLSSGNLPFGIRETENLTFYLYSSALSSTATSTTLSTYIVSDYNFLQYNLQTTSPNDYIKFTPIVTEALVISALKCFYGPSLSKEYSLLSPAWIPVVSGKDFIITYPNVEYGEIKLAIKTSLSSVNGFLDSTKIDPIILAKGQPPRDTRDPMYLDVINEQEDFINIDSSFIISESAFPFRDLRNSYISWFTEPSNSFITINAIDLSGNYITSITPYSAILFGPESSTVQVSGYGPTTTKIFLSSQKYNITASVTSNSSLFDFFAENKFLIGPSIPLNNLNITRTIQLTAAIPYKGRVYTMPNDTTIYWDWQYDDVKEADLQPINSTYVSQPSSYVLGEENFAYLLSALNFQITPSFSDLYPEVHKIKIKAFSYTKFPPVSGEYNLEVDDFPSPSIYNTDFSVSYNGSSTNIGNTRINRRVITRPESVSNVFILSGNSDVLPRIFVPPNGSISWRQSDNVSGDVAFKLYTSGSNINYFLDLASSSPYKTSITLSANNCIVPGWLSGHSISTTAYFYIIPTAEFNQSLDFIIYPEFAWLGGPYTTLLTDNNYTLIPSPTAYAHTTSETQIYKVSANKSNFNSYIYGANNFRIETLESLSGNVEVPFYNQIYSINGLTISLSAYNDEEYPEEYGTSYIDENNTKQLFNNVTQTSPFPSTLASRKYSRSPKLIPYDEIPFSFSALNLFIDLDNNKFINITQYIGTSSLPTQHVPNEGTITYILSSDYWVKYVEVPAIDKATNSILLNIGDPYTEGFIDGSKSNTLYLNASASVPVRIPSSTFNNYDTIQYPGNRNLWNTIIQPITSNLANPWTTITAYITSNKPEIYISSYYNLTGQPILIQFNTPTNIGPNNITQYALSLQDETITIPFSSSLYYAFSAEGTFYIAYSAIYSDSSIVGFNLNLPIIIKQNWQSYNQEDIRILDETLLKLPYNIEEIEIQPNEWGDADIFNTAIGRLYDNLEYLKSNSQTLNTDTPTVYYGWLGCNSLFKSAGIRWYTETYGKDYYNTPSLASNNGTSYFSDIRSIAASDSHVFVLDKTIIRAFSASKIPVERNFANTPEISALFVSPVSLSIDKTGYILYAADSIKNQIFRFDLDLSFVPRINISNIVGGFGYRQDVSKFSTPTEITNFNDNVFVLDYSNNCIKHYNDNLNWLYTYFIDSFITIKPINILIHPTELLYVLTENYTIYIFDYLNDTPIQTISLPEVSITNEKIVKLIFDETGEFLYVLTETKIYKYTATGYFISFVNIPDTLTYTSGCSLSPRSLLFSTKNSIIKIQDILEIFKIGEGLPSQYWSKEQITVKPNELSSDITYNKSLIRLAQNIKTFRNNLNSKFTIVSEQTDIGIIYYFALQPINTTDRPSLPNDVELETLSVGVNELHIPQSINKELLKLYNSLNILNNFLSIDPISINNSLSGLNDFCWSWKATSCYGLSLPVIRITNINPITYEELYNSFPLAYAPNRTWGQATSVCCKDFEKPVII